MPPNKSNNNALRFALVAILSFVLGWQLTVAGMLGNLDFNKNGSQDDESAFGSESVNMDLFWAVWGELETKYVNETLPNRQERVYGAIKGLVGALNDPYTVFMDPKETESFTESLEGTLEGIGAELTVENKNLVVVSPLRNSPAEKSGLLPGDIIYKIDDKLTTDMTLFEAIMNIRGEKGTSVKLEILRKNVQAPIELSIIRDSIDIESLTIENLPGEIAYITVNQFNDKTTEEFNKVVSKMVLNPPKGMVIDLRYNGGGYLDTAVTMLSHIIPANEKAVVIKQRGKDDEVLLTNNNTKIIDVPLVILINEGSASASEIVAGAVQDLKRGVVMGTKSFGKGSVQEVESFGDGSSMRITVAKWYTPNGRNIDNMGIVPDIIVEQISQEEIEKALSAGKEPRDLQRERAIEYLKGLKK